MGSVYFNINPTRVHTASATTRRKADKDLVDDYIVKHRNGHSACDKEVEEAFTKAMQELNEKITRRVTNVWCTLIVIVVLVLLVVFFYHNPVVLLLIALLVVGGVCFFACWLVPMCIIAYMQ